MNWNAFLGYFNLGVTNRRLGSHSTFDAETSEVSRRLIELGTIAGWVFIGFLLAPTVIAPTSLAYTVGHPQTASDEKLELLIAHFRTPGMSAPTAEDTALLQQLLREHVATDSVALGRSLETTLTFPLIIPLLFLVIAGFLAIFASRFGYFRPLILRVRASWGSYFWTHGKRWALEIFYYLALALGIFARQNLDVASLGWSTVHFSLGSFAGSCVIALAIFPYVMRKVTRLRPKPGLELLAWPFSMGFFIDLVRLAAISVIPWV